MKENKMDTTKQKAGFVAVVGRPNAGKSSLLNHLAGFKLAMVSKKAQATRKRMNIIVMHKEAQIIFVDTPGIHEKERLLNQFMMDEVLKAVGDCDLAIFVAPINDSLSEYEKFLNLIEKKGVEHIVVLNKIDRVSNERILKKIREYSKYQDRFLALIPYSVKKNIGKEQLLDEIAKHLPNHPWLYDPELLTTENIRDIYKELIREAIFDKLSDEIPYESDVIIEKVDERDNIDRVYATIVTEKNSQKRMIIGNGGEGIKRIGKKARELMEEFAQKKIYLELHVSERKGWSKSKKGLEEVGYIF
jgi:GTP-binding protein Era